MRCLFLCNMQKKRKEKKVKYSWSSQRLATRLDIHIMSVEGPRALSCLFYIVICFTGAGKFTCRKGRIGTLFRLHPIHWQPKTCTFLFHIIHDSCCSHAVLFTMHYRLYTNYKLTDLEKIIYRLYNYKLILDKNIHAPVINSHNKPVKRGLSYLAYYMWTTCYILNMLKCVKVC